MLRADGRVHTIAVDNQITDAGDSYMAARVAAGVGPTAPAQPAALITGMKLGTGTLAAAKNGPGATLAGYLPGSNRPLDAGYPQVAPVGPGAGTQVSYQVTFPAGVGTGDLTEAVLVTDAATNTTPAAAAVVARVTFGPQTKGPGDSLIALWTHTHLA